MLRDDGQFSELEAKVLDICLVLHAEHGGGNNSTFTTHVVSSSGTDTYSAIAAALGSLKGPKHGGANIKVVRMFDDMKSHVKDWTDEEEVSNYLRKLLHKEAFDQKGLIYGMGHAVYSISDPRARIFKTFVEQLAKRKTQRERLPAVRYGRGTGSEDHRRGAPYLQRCIRKRRLLQRLRLQHAGSSAGALHPDVRLRAYRRLECTPDGGTDQHRQDHPPGVQECQR